MTVRELIRSYQREIQQTNDLQGERAADLLMKLTSLLGNCNDEIRQADTEYAAELLRCLDSEEKANRARIRAETSEQYARKREAQDTKELAIELARSLKYFLRSKAEELQMARYQ